MENRESAVIEILIVWDGILAFDCVCHLALFVSFCCRVNEKAHCGIHGRGFDGTDGTVRRDNGIFLLEENKELVQAMSCQRGHILTFNN